MTIANPAWLYPAYIFNIVILVPVVWGLAFGGGVATVFEGKVPVSDGLSLMVASLWFAILAASVVGLMASAFFAPVVLIQIVYKSAWLLVYALPRYQAAEPVPSGVATVFLIIVAVYPVLFWLAARGAD